MAIQERSWRAATTAAGSSGRRRQLGFQGRATGRPPRSACRPPGRAPNTGEQHECPTLRHQVAGTSRAARRRGDRQQDVHERSEERKPNWKTKMFGSVISPTPRGVAVRSAAKCEGNLQRSSSSGSAVSKARSVPGAPEASARGSQTTLQAARSICDRQVGIFGQGIEQ